MARLTLDLRAMDVDGQIIADPEVFVRVARLDDTGASEARLELTGAPARIRFNDGPSGTPIKLRITTSRYRDSLVVARVDGDRRILPIGDLRLPRRTSEWVPAFKAWSELPAAFSALQNVLTNSPAFRLGRTSPTELFVDQRYDAVDPADESRVLAKLALLNLYARLRTELVPETTEPWFGTVKEVFLATRERLIAEVEERCWMRVQDLADTPRAGYREAPVGDHKQNLELIPGVAQVTELASVKTRESRGNLQFTVARARRDGRATFLLDADIDENGNLLLHTFDLIRHAFNGGTHPIDIHEYLRVSHPDVELGYRLDPRIPVAATSARVLPSRSSAARRRPAAKRPTRRPRPSRTRKVTTRTRTASRRKRNS
jgi:hypothetical protein